MTTPSTPRDTTTLDSGLRVTVADGKYTVVQGADGRLWALRYGEKWRDCTGDGLICALAHEIERLRGHLKEHLDYSTSVMCVLDDAGETMAIGIEDHLTGHVKDVPELSKGLAMWRAFHRRGLAGSDQPQPEAPAHVV